MGSSKVKTIQDPLAQQKTQASNIGLGNYQAASAAIPGLQSYFNQNFGKSNVPNFGAGIDPNNPLLSDVYGSVQRDLSGGTGPFSSLKQNLLGSFDTGQVQAQKGLEQQLQAQGLLGSGAGMAVLGNQGVDAAQQRALLGNQQDVSELNFANQLGQQQFNNQNTLAQYLQQQFQDNQLAGFQDPMAALGQIQSLSSPPNFQNLDNQYFQQPSTFSQVAPLLGQVAGAAATAIPGIMAAKAATGATTGMNLGAFPTASNFYAPTQSQISSPLTFQGPFRNTFYQ